MNRYGKITQKKQREIVLLKGAPCFWGKCVFCDYIDDNDPDQDACNCLNAQVLSQVTGEFGALEVINSGSVFELPPQTLSMIRDVVRSRRIRQLFFESHWHYRERLHEMEEYFGIPVIFKCGIETFDDNFRNHVLKKGITFESPQEVRRYFQSVCLLVGIEGQTQEMIRRDIDTLLEHFDYGCINIFNENTTPIHRDEKLIRWFYENYRHLEAVPGLDILWENTDFGVGELQ